MAGSAPEREEAERAYVDFLEMSAVEARRQTHARNRRFLFSLVPAATAILVAVSTSLGGVAYYASEVGILISGILATVVLVIIIGGLTGIFVSVRRWRREMSRGFAEIEDAGVRDFVELQARQHREFFLPLLSRNESQQGGR